MKIVNGAFYMKKNIFNGMYESGNMMPLTAEEIIQNNNCCVAAQEDEYKYDYIMPVELRIILKYINNECDKYEYEDSPMFDELPEKTFIDEIVRIVAERYRNDEKDNNYFVDKNSDLLIYALLIGVIVYRKNRHACIKSNKK